tara:strand:+ start:439 stop:792 length:354 start_codon:yes stop_codon:yes gene_type:complete
MKTFNELLENKYTIIKIMGKHFFINSFDQGIRYEFWFAAVNVDVGMVVQPVTMTLRNQEKKLTSHWYERKCMQNELGVNTENMGQIQEDALKYVSKLRAFMTDLSLGLEQAQYKEVQ